jgi:hypothetical protein
LTECDPAPGAPAVCAAGFHCQSDGFCGQYCTQGGSECGPDAECTSDGRCVPIGACVGLECQQVECSGGGTTSITGTVYAPNGTLPLYNATVYIPNGPVGAIPSTLSCDRCGAGLTGDPLVETKTNTMGQFTLNDVPAGIAVPLIIQIGKWRRQVTLPPVTACTSATLDVGQTRLPRNQGEGDIPRMALTTGDADALECLLRKIGLDDDEITNAAGSGRVHLFAGAGGTDQFDAAHGGASFTNATTLWDDVASLSAYDVVLLSCEGGQNLGSKPTAARQAMKDYADAGGRVFASHWHNVWLERGPAPWPTTVSRMDLSDLNSITADIDQTTPQGGDLAQWLLNVGASTVLGQIAITEAQHTITAVSSQVTRWIYKDVTANGEPSVQYLSFTTPLEEAQAARCGRVVFSDIHVSGGDESSTNLDFPSETCTTSVATLTPQEKVLAFMIFDIASCIPDIIE